MKYILTYLLIVFSCLLYGQEICNNLIDDDGDGLIDCWDKSCNGSGICPPGIPCAPTESFYNIREKSFQKRLPLDFNPQVINSILNSNIDAIGYNVLDGYIYGIDVSPVSGSKTGNKLVRIDGNGNVTNFGMVNGLPEQLTNRKYIAGEMDDQGILYVSNYADTVIYAIDVDQSPLSANKIFIRHFNQSGNHTNLPAFDIVRHSNGLFYALGKDYLYEMKLDLNATSTTLNAKYFANIIGGAYGSAFTDNSGVLYFIGHGIGIATHVMKVENISTSLNASNPTLSSITHTESTFNTSDGASVLEICPTPPKDKCCRTDIDVKSNSTGPLTASSFTHQGKQFNYAQETFIVQNNSTIPITEIRAVVRDVKFEYNYDDCAVCVDDPYAWASIWDASQNIGPSGSNLSYEQQPYYSGNVNLDETIREIIWSNPSGVMLTAGHGFKISYNLPDVSDIPCCVSSATICLDISWRDANCKVCSMEHCVDIDLSGNSNTPGTGTGTSTGSSSGSNPGNGARIMKSNSGQNNADRSRLSKPSGESNIPSTVKGGHHNGSKDEIAAPLPNDEPKPRTAPAAEKEKPQIVRPPVSEPITQPRYVSANYQIQLVVSSRPDKSYPKLDPIGSVSVVKMQGKNLYKYLLDGLTSEEEAREKLAQVQRVGFEKAYILKDGKRLR